MSKLHNAITVVLTLGVALLGADRIAHSGPDREMARQIDEIRRNQTKTLGDGQKEPGRHEQYAIPAVGARVEQAGRRTPVDDAAEENEDSTVASQHHREPHISPEEMQSGLDKVFYAAPRDRSWGPQAESIVRESFKKTMPEGSHVESLSCNASSCRIETSHGNMDEYQKFAETSILGPATGLWNGAAHTAVVRDEQGELTAVSYIAREGMALPVVQSM